LEKFLSARTGQRKTLDHFLQKLRTGSANALQKAVCHGRLELQITLSHDFVTFNMMQLWCHHAIK